jgi:uncharacterized protein YbbK (DUF523 family)
MKMIKKPKLVSACLLGLNCRYDGKSKPDKKVIRLATKEILIPVCPEQLGGLPTPREPQERRGNRVFTISGKDVTKEFERGAQETLTVARLMSAQEAILKQRSPSCGCGQIYDGTFKGKIIEGEGVTASLLKKNGIRVMTEEDLK